MKQSILLLSKNETTNARLARALRQGDYEVFPTSDEKAGLYFFHGHPVDAVILDMRHDWRTARRLKEMNQFVPVICIAEKGQ